jgi:hypothetical protein
MHSPWRRTNLAEASSERFYSVSRNIVVRSAQESGKYQLHSTFMLMASQGWLRMTRQ